jgi:hypothetical protein
MHVDNAVQRLVALVRAGGNGAIPARDDHECPDYYIAQSSTPPCVLAEAIMDTNWGTLEAGREVIDFMRRTLLVQADGQVQVDGQEAF